MKKLFLSIFFLGLFLLQTHAQAPNWLWAKSAGGTANEYAQSISTDASGNVFVTGYFQSQTITLGATTLTNASTTGTNPNIFIVKYDASGNVLWAKSGGGISPDIGFGIATDKGGNVFITGVFQSTAISFGTLTLTHSGNPNSSSGIFVVKYDGFGNVLWAKSAGGASASDYGQSIATDASGNVLVTGYFQSSTITLGTYTLTNAGVGNNDIFVVKYDANGNVLWAKAAGGTSDDRGMGISTDANGNVFVSGYFASPTITFGTTTFSTSIITVFVVKYDALGNALWARASSNNLSCLALAIATDVYGNVLVTGFFDQPTITFRTTTLTSTGNNDIFIVKYDASGNVLWAKSSGGTYDDMGNGISTDAMGNVFVTGRFYSSSITFGTTNLINAGATSMTSDIFVAKYDALGNVLWARAAGGTIDDYGVSNSNDSNGNVFVAGYFSSPSFTCGANTLSNSGGNDVFIARIGDNNVGINEYSNTYSGVKIYPNPNTGKINFSSSSNEMFDLIMNNALGQTVFEKENLQNNSSLEMKLEKGIYFYSIQNKEGRKQTGKLLVE